MLDLVDETLNQMTLFVEMFIILTLLFPICSRRDHYFRLALCNSVKKILGIVGTISDQTLKLISCHQIFCLCDVVALPTSQHKTQRVAQRIHTYVDFGAEAASAASQCLFSLPTVFLEAPAAQG